MRLKNIKNLFLILTVYFLFNLQPLTSQKIPSLKTDPENLLWWKEATFGLFIHWGVYSRLAGTWEDSTYSGYAEHIFRMAQIPIERYKNEVAANFNPVKFNAEEWVKIAKGAGMNYIVITAKHHDGFAMWDSKVPGWGDDYDVKDATPFNRDPMAELKKACDKHGVKLGFYYSHAQDWSHPYGQRNTWDYKHPTERGKWHKDPNWSEHLENSLKYVYEKSIPQLKELITNYNPSIIWFDTRDWLPEEYNRIIVSEVRKIAPDVIFNSRSSIKSKDYKTTADRPDEFPPYPTYWEAIPTTNESYGYHPGDTSHKPASHFIKLLSKSSARGGNLLLNVGPMGNGEIDPTDVNILSEIGEWMQVNGEAIYGDKRTTLPVNAWGESTMSGDKLYLHVFKWPKDGKLVVGGLLSKVEKAYLLSDKKKRSLDTKVLDEKTLIINVPQKAPHEIVSMIVLDCEGEEVETDPVRLLSSKSIANKLHVFDGSLVGDKISYGSGSHKNNHINKWSINEGFVKWNVRSNKEVTYNVFISYNAPKESDKNEYIVEIGKEKIKGKVISEIKYKPIKLGQVKIEKGEMEIAVKPIAIKGDVLMNLRSVILEPIN